MLLRIGSLFVGSLILLAYSTMAPPAVHYWISAGSILLAVGGAALVMRIARLTQMCTNSNPKAKAVLAATQGHVGGVLSGAFQSFLISVQGSPTGIYICNIHITYEFFCTITARMVLQIPVLVTVVTGLFQRKAA